MARRSSRRAASLLPELCILAAGILHPCSRSPAPLLPVLHSVFARKLCFVYPNFISSLHNFILFAKDKTFQRIENHQPFDFSPFLASSGQTHRRTENNASAREAFGRIITKASEKRSRAAPLDIEANGAARAILVHYLRYRPRRCLPVSTLLS